MDAAARHRQHANSFGQAADVYDRARPSYPPDAVEWMLQSHPSDVVDLGAGTGIFTRLIANWLPVANRGNIAAVDPSADMLAKLHGVRTLVGSGEHIPLPDASVDLVTCAQAWHWVDPTLAVPEVARVLRPGGWLAIVWNARDDRVPWVASMSSIIHDSPAEEIADNPPKLGSPFDSLFGEVETFETTWSMPISRDELDELVTSRSMYLVGSAAARRATMRELHAMLDTHLDTAGRDTLELPYRTFCYRAQC